MHEQRLTILGDLERAIMDIVWSREGATVRDVVDALRSSRTPAYTTVMTVMNRLVEKKLLQRKQGGQSFRYSAVKSKCDFLCQCSREVVHTFAECYGDLGIAQMAAALSGVQAGKGMTPRAKPRSRHERGRRTP